MAPPLCLFHPIYIPPSANSFLLPLQPLSLTLWFHLQLNYVTLLRSRENCGTEDFEVRFVNSHTDTGKQVNGTIAKDR